MLLARPISHIGIKCMDSVEIFNVLLDLYILIFLLLMGVELLLCPVVTLS